ncbi:TetR/AcrR family transcriptional regulator [Streptomyces cacaoi]|uniref:TetR/AcrR family transcriptional regulator n=1 Tax=Streptomyces cacaoi TaxID=1898 RepID=UPI003748FEF2
MPEHRSGKPRYHHGDLRNALVRAAVDLARDGGPEAVVLRAAARRVGVSATAAYRHFSGQSDLLAAVKDHAQQCLVAAMEESREGIRGEGVEAAREGVKALGRGYVRFALREPGLFRSAFCGTVDPLGADAAGPPHGGQHHPQVRSFQMLTESLDALAEAGALPPTRRQGAELSAWAMVHGVAVLIMGRHLGELTQEQTTQVVERAFDDLVAGLAAP